MTHKRIQRALVVTMGPLAGQVGQGLEAWLQQDDAPRAAVAVTHVAQPAPLAGQLAQGLASISQTTMRAELLAGGWQPDHLDEIGLYLVLDAAYDALPPEDVAAAAAQLAYELLGVATAGMLLALLPEGHAETAAARLPRLAQQVQLFPRGVVACGLTNEVGLRLPDAGALAAAAADLLKAIISTPLRDGLEWAGSLGETTGGLMSMGLAGWYWSASQARARLAACWVDMVLAQWRLDAGEPAAAEQQAQGWLAQTQLVPEALVARLRARLPAAIDGPRWAYPQPWALHQLVADICPELPDDAPILTRTSEQLSQEAWSALTAAAAARLDEAAVGGTAFALAWLCALARRLEALQDEAADRQELIASRLAAAGGGRQAVQAALEEMLSGWPQPTLRGWLGAAARPWLWPGLVWRYARIQQLAQLLAQRCREQAQWQRHSALAAAIQTVYRGLETAVQHVSRQADELDEMIGYLQTVLAERRPPWPQAEIDDLAWLPGATLLHQPAQEAALAASAIGGLGAQLTRPDDAILGPLLAAARERLDDVMRITAVDALLAQHADPAALAQWWTLACEQAAPLWCFDATQVPDRLRSQRQLLTLVCAQGGRRLQERLGLPQEQQVRWIESPQVEGVWVLQVRRMALERA